MLFLSHHLKKLILSLPQQQRKMCLQPQRSRLSKVLCEMSKALHHCQDGFSELFFHVAISATAQAAPHIEGPLIPNRQLSCSPWTQIPAPRASLDLDLMWAHRRMRWGVSKRNKWFDRNHSFLVLKWPPSFFTGLSFCFHWLFLQWEGTAFVLFLWYCIQ